MLACRVIPQILVDGRKMVKGTGFNPWRSVGVPQQAVKIHQMRQVDELIITDVKATPEGRGPDLDLIQELAEQSFSPLTVGGGVRSVDDIRKLLRYGADKVLIGTAAVKDKLFICEAAARFGSSTLVGAIDVKLVKGEYLCHIKCGTEPTLVRPWQLARNLEECGIGEILLMNIDAEGLMTGYDHALIRAVSGEVSIPVVVAGGCSGYTDMVKAVAIGADAVSAGALFQFSSATPRGASEYLQSHGVEARCI